MKKILSLLSLLLAVSLTSSAQPELVYNNTKFQSATETRWLDTENGVIAGLLKNGKTVQVVDLTNNQLKHEFDLASKGIKKAKFYVAETAEFTIYFHDEKTMVVYDYLTNTVKWTFDEAPVTDVTIGRETVGFSIKPKLKGAENFLVLDKKTGVVIDRQVQDEKADKWNIAAWLGDAVLEIKEKGNMASVLVGKVEVRVRNHKTKVVLASHELTGVSSFYRTFTDAANNRIVLAMPESKNATMNLKERGAKFQFVALSAIDGSVSWKYSSPVAVDFHIYEYVSNRRYYTPVFSKTGEGLFFAGIKSAEFIEFATGKSRWQAPVVTSTHDGMLSPKLFDFTAFMIDEKAGTATFADFTDEKKPVLMTRKLSDGAVLSSVPLASKTVAVPYILQAADGNIWVQENGNIVSEKPKAQTVKFIKPVTITLTDASGNVKWRTTFKEDVTASSPVGVGGFAGTAKDILQIDGATGKASKPVAHKIKADEYLEFNPMPKHNGVLVWGSNGFSFVRLK